MLDEILRVPVELYPELASQLEGQDYFLPRVRLADWDRENIPDWTDFDEHEAQRLFARAFREGSTPTAEQKRDVMRMSRSMVVLAKTEKVGPYAG